MYRWITTLIIVVVFLAFGGRSQALDVKTYYQDGFPKYFYKSINGKKEIRGLCVEIMRLIEQKDPEIRFVAENRLVKFKRIKKDLQQGKIDVFLGMTHTKEREKQFTYIHLPLYQVNHVIAVRTNDEVKVNNFKDIRELGGQGLILSNQGTSTERFLKKQGGLLLDTGAQNLTNNLIKLLKKRGRFLYFHNLGLVSTIRDEDLTDRVRILPAVFHTYGHHLVFSNKAPKEAVEKVQRIMEEITASGELEKITRRYFQL